MAEKSLSIEEYESLNPHMVLEHGGCRIRYATPNPVTVWRVQTILQKEPITIEWIASFAPGCVLVDVGANVGMYSMLAAVTRQARVFAFEPESQNFAVLNRNIVMNEVQDLVCAWPAALSNSSGLDRLHVSSFRIGGSCHSFGEALDFNLQEAKFELAQGSVSVTLDEAVASGTVPVPNHIKIDVDGFEHRVVDGARETLARPEVESLLIEVNPKLEEHQMLIRDLASHGFGFDPEQVRRATRTEGAFEGVGEHLFRRRV